MTLKKGLNFAYKRSSYLYFELRVKRKRKINKYLSSLMTLSSLNSCLPPSLVAIITYDTRATIFFTPCKFHYPTCEIPLMLVDCKFLAQQFLIRVTTRPYLRIRNPNNINKKSNINHDLLESTPSMKLKKYLPS